MRLYVNCRHQNHRIYLNLNARVRAELPYYFGVRCQAAGCPGGQLDQWFSPQEVTAEPGMAGRVGGGLGLGALGLLVAGPLGGIIGAMVGGLAGNQADEGDRQAAGRFNDS